MDKLRFQSFGSGSSGNCYFIGNANYGILIDAGVGVRFVRKCLKQNGLDYSNIWGVFVTHDHADHIRAIGSIGERFRIPVYTTKKIHEGISKSYCVTEKLSSSRKLIEIGETVIIGDFRVQAFAVSHDASECVGYTIRYLDKKITIATDLGEISQSVIEHVSNSDYLVIESNYDEKMLQEGPYPAYLKNRIKATTGHLSNKQTGEFLEEHYHAKIKQIFLCHLSKENNTPEVAFNTVARYLKNKTFDLEIQLKPLPRTESTGLITLID